VHTTDTRKDVTDSIVAAVTIVTVPTKEKKTLEMREKGEIKRESYVVYEFSLLYFVYFDKASPVGQFAKSSGTPCTSIFQIFSFN
jgi:hypothetical protein